MADEFTKAALYGIKTFNEKVKEKVKEKIGMQKLIALLNEYDPYIASDGEHKPNLLGYAYQGHSAIFPKELAESYIVSARYGFIKWLVENDKIDLLQLDNRIALSEFNKVERVLMALSISDTPIEDLISYLK